MKNREGLIQELALTLNKLNKYDDRNKIKNYYLFNADNAIAQIAFGRYAKKYDAIIPLGDIERFIAELSMLSDKTLLYYKKILSGETIF